MNELGPEYRQFRNRAPWADSGEGMDEVANNVNDLGSGPEYWQFHNGAPLADSGGDMDEMGDDDEGVGIESCPPPVAEVDGAAGDASGRNQLQEDLDDEEFQGMLLAGFRERGLDLHSEEVRAALHAGLQRRGADLTVFDKACVDAGYSR